MQAKNAAESPVFAQLTSCMRTRGMMTRRDLRKRKERRSSKVAILGGKYDYEWNVMMEYVGKEC